ncbi:peptidoglycan-binding domain-containing protein [Streptomyces hokutonensis]|uniref:peptidoglycan-binding domain-containing protein n=1 Tax=Streptomyces hokutonensis TaxID=1306990 RepID=UPI0033E0E653
MSNKIARAATVLTLLISTLGGITAIGATTANAAETCDRTKHIHHAIVPASVAGVNCLLSVGNGGEGVRALQLTLRRCYGSTITADGIFGTATRDALRYAQRQAGTQDDGIYGPNTRRAIKHRPSNLPYGCQRVG